MKVFVSIIDPHGNQNIYQVGNKPRVIGRSEKSEIRVSDDLASGRHCQVFINNKNELIVEDIGSKNGTSFNGVKKLTHTVYIGDEILFGGSKLSINTQKSDPEAIDHLTFKGDQAKRKSKDITLELETTNQAKSKSKKISTVSKKPLSEMSAKERSLYQQQKMYGGGEKQEKRKSPQDDKLVTLKFYLADFIDFLIPSVTIILSFIIMSFLNPQGIEHITNLNFKKILSVDVISYPLAGTLMAMLVHKLNRKNKKGSIGEKILGLA